MEAQFEFRLATLADKSQILRCHGDQPGSVYDGLDYLPVRFEATLACWNKLCGLCIDTAAGIAVAYCQIFVFDNKRHMLLTALRVHHQYQGRGIATRLRNFLCREARSRFPDVTPDVRFCVYDAEFVKAEFFAKSPDYDLISKRHYYMLDFPLSSLAQLQSAISAAALAQQAQPAVPVWTDRRAAYLAMMADPGYCRIFANGNPVFINDEPVELIAENLEILPGYEESRLSALLTDGEKLTVGFGSFFQCSRGIRADLDAYSNWIDRSDFSTEAMAVTLAAVVVQFIDRLLATQLAHLVQLSPHQSLTIFVSLDCLNPLRFNDCPTCSLEKLLDEQLRGCISQEVLRKLEYYSEGCPYALLKRQVLLE